MSMDIRKYISISMRLLRGLSGPETTKPKSKAKTVNDLRRMNFFGADLRGFDFTDADLSEADMRYADVRAANFTRAKLNEARITNWITQSKTPSQQRPADPKGERWKAINQAWEKRELEPIMLTLRSLSDDEERKFLEPLMDTFKDFTEGRAAVEVRLAQLTPAYLAQSHQIAKVVDVS